MFASIALIVYCLLYVYCLEILNCILHLSLHSALGLGCIVDATKSGNVALWMHDCKRDSWLVVALFHKNCCFQMNCGLVLCIWMKNHRQYTMHLLLLCVALTKWLKCCWIRGCLAERDIVKRSTSDRNFKAITCVK